MANWPANGTASWNPAMLAYWAIEHETDGTHQTDKRGYQDRGDPAPPDYSALTTDGNWNDLDLGTDVSVPSGAKAVVLKVLARDDAVGSVVKFRSNANANAIAAPAVYTQVANILVSDTFIVACDSSQIIEYNASNTTWTNIEVTILGWFL